MRKTSTSRYHFHYLVPEESHRNLGMATAANSSPINAKYPVMVTLGLKSHNTIPVVSAAFVQILPATWTLNLAPASLEKSPSRSYQTLLIRYSIASAKTNIDW